MFKRSKKNGIREEHFHSLDLAVPLVRSTPPESPENFAERLLQLEFELETSCCLALVNELMELYQQAIEYFEYKGDPKYLDLQTRLQKTLLRSDVMTVLSKANSTPTSSKHDRSLVASAEKMPEIPALLSSSQTQELIRRKKEDLGRCVRTQAAELQRDSAFVPAQVSRNLNRLFESQESDTRDATKKARGDLERQGEQLKSKLSMRVSSRKNSRKTSPGADKRLPNQDVDMAAVARRLDQIPAEQRGDASTYRRKCSNSAQLSPRASSTAASSEAGEGRSHAFDDLERKLEEVMERSFVRKSEKVAEIREKFEAELQEMQKEGPATGIMLQVLEQTRLTMEREIEEAKKAMDQQRREEVRQLRLQYIAQ